MIGLDTNVLVRYLTQDDAAQAVLATRLVESMSKEQPGFVSLLVLVELVWVLESCYSADGDKIATVVETMLRTDGLVVARAKVVWQALRQFRRKAGDFADTLIAQLAQDAGCTSVQTFDKGAAGRAGMTLLS